ncbi:hypothetical protein C8R45DRAFT_944549 [Mycena sanguinolenta]|nr:hypothetical protein C8R45DRAFT_944549 [Mycena sanguinolenta]
MYGGGGGGGGGGGSGGGGGGGGSIAGVKGKEHNNNAPPIPPPLPLLPSPPPPPLPPPLPPPPSYWCYAEAHWANCMEEAKFPVMFLVKEEVLAVQNMLDTCVDAPRTLEGAYSIVQAVRRRGKATGGECGGTVKRLNMAAIHVEIYWVSWVRWQTPGPMHPGPWRVHTASCKQCGGAVRRTEVVTQYSNKSRAQLTKRGEASASTRPLLAGRGRQMYNRELAHKPYERCHSFWAMRVIWLRAPKYDENAVALEPCLFAHAPLKAMSSYGFGANRLLSLHIRFSNWVHGSEKFHPHEKSECTTSTRHAGKSVEEGQKACR